MISFSERAVEKVQEFAAQMPEAEGKELRIFIQGVGCSGFASASPSTKSVMETPWSRTATSRFWSMRTPRPTSLARP